MPEGDSLHRAARKLQVLVGERVGVETPHPRAAVSRVAERLDGRKLVGVEAAGKNLLLSFEGGLVLRSHLRMTGRWQLVKEGTRRVGNPWLVLRGGGHEAVLWNGPVLELSARGALRLGPDILAEPPDFDRDGRQPAARAPDTRARRRAARPALGRRESGTSGRRSRSGTRRSRRGGGSAT